MQIQKVQKWFVVYRDVGSYLLGIFIIIYQTLTKAVNVDLLLAALALIGTPGAIAAVQLFRGSVATEPTDITEPSSPSPQLPLQPEPLPRQSSTG